MSDLVERAAAINAVETLLNGNIDIVERIITENNVTAICAKIMDLPAAQPEKRTEERTETRACDLISRQTAIDMFQNLANDDWNKDTSTTWANTFAESADMIEDLPSAQPQRIRGKWIRHKDWVSEGYCEYTCSECDTGVDVMYNYCPRCGARMDGGEQDG